MNLMGALRKTMATSGYSDLKEFQRVEVVVTSSEPRRGTAGRAG
jgi:IMP dehydrogenase